MLFSAGNVRDLARVTRAIGSLARLNQVTIDEYRRTLQRYVAQRGILVPARILH